MHIWTLCANLKKMLSKGENRDQALMPIQIYRSSNIWCLYWEIYESFTNLDTQKIRYKQRLYATVKPLVLFSNLVEQSAKHDLYKYDISVLVYVANRLCSKCQTRNGQQSRQIVNESHKANGNEVIYHHKQRIR